MPLEFPVGAMGEGRSGFCLTTALLSLLGHKATVPRGSHGGPSEAPNSGVGADLGRPDATLDSFCSGR